MKEEIARDVPMPEVGRDLSMDPNTIWYRELTRKRMVYFGALIEIVRANGRRIYPVVRPSSRARMQRIIKFSNHVGAMVFTVPDNLRLAEAENG